MKIRKQKDERGITLVALIITIIILVILAAVSISAAYNSGIIFYAMNGTRDYTNAAREENRIMSNTGSKIDNALNGLKK